MNPTGFTRCDLGDGLAIFAGRVPDEIVWSADDLATAWALRPAERPIIHLHGRRVAIPRWQRAYGADYHFSGQVSRSLPVPAFLQPLLQWSRSAIHPALNGLLLNWYDGPGHYIGPHRDSEKRMAPGAPIVTISFGETRVFRLSRDRESVDRPVGHGDAIVLPRETNEAWKHAVPKSKRYVGRRISVTIRGFDE